MGLRVRLKAEVDISRFPKQARIVLQALETYGMILADNRSNWYPGSDFEVVDTSSLPHPGLR